MDGVDGGPNIFDTVPDYFEIKRADKIGQFSDQNLKDYYQEVTLLTKKSAAYHYSLNCVRRNSLTFIKQADNSIIFTLRRSMFLQNIYNYYYLDR